MFHDCSIQCTDPLFKIASFVEVQGTLKVNLLPFELVRQHQNGVIDLICTSEQPNVQITVTDLTGLVHQRNISFIGARFADNDGLRDIPEALRNILAKRDTWRQRAAGKRVVSLPIGLFGDDFGSRSKSRNQNHKWTIHFRTNSSLFQLQSVTLPSLLLNHMGGSVKPLCQTRCRLSSIAF